MNEPTWAAVVPVKRLNEAKSRLRGALPDVPHEALALALARDTVAAVLACPAVANVVVVTSDPRVSQAARSAGARVVSDPGTGLNGAVAHGAALIGDQPVVALTADLPALHPAELAAALRAVADGPQGVRRFVADTPGTGTVLLAAVGVPLRPRFGPGSAAAHAASDALAIDGRWPTLRRDVDTATDLAEAIALGLGRHTDALVARSAVAAGPHLPRPV